MSEGPPSRLNNDWMTPDYTLSNGGFAGFHYVLRNDPHDLIKFQTNGNSAAAAAPL
jgi:hypothetical protein